MNPLLLKAKFKALVQACGGLDEAVAACRAAEESGQGRAYSKAQLSRCCVPTAPDFAPIDIVAVLEDFCGEPIVSRALVEARPAVAGVGDIRDEASEATEAAASLQGAVRRALAGDNRIEAHEAREILDLVEKGMAEFRDVASSLGDILKGRS
ncbi:hypothetical protein KOAAANKH_00119 [Brevundimonas sp. NIBR10]|uniref:hypothetical protein n=1 Tax=Brevundimonas sp. NIBR10 TaxID=3015997 RepID=UPI0022F16439|nr:hypothetical protein [Brevundimonas sp. NIBR10]WGM45258.1 hypothetical protein KOAAANKH_00119 [Brevundimonas sp. NIBR10]